MILKKYRDEYNEKYKNICGFDEYYSCRRKKVLTEKDKESKTMIKYKCSFCGKFHLTRKIHKK